MKIEYDQLTSAFLAKITEYNFLNMPDGDRQEIVDGYRRRAWASFASVCMPDDVKVDDDKRAYEITGDDDTAADEIIEIVSDGMGLQWLKQYLYKQENLENMLNTADFSAYSPAELTYRITNAYNSLKKEFRDAVVLFTYRHGDLTDLHL